MIEFTWSQTSAQSEHSPIALVPIRFFYFSYLSLVSLSTDEGLDATSKLMTQLPLLTV